MVTLNLSDQIIKSLSQPELTILKYTYEHTKAVLDMSIQQLAAEVSYSSATILRFCKKMGYSGFAEFKYALRMEARTQRTAAPVWNGMSSFTSGMMIDVLSSNMQATSRLIREEELLRTYQYLDSGCPIYLWSPGGLTSIVVEYFEKLLLSIGRREVYIIESVKMCEHILRNRSSESLLVLISASGKYATTIRLGKIAQVNGIPVLSITPYTNNEIAGLANVNFRFFTDERENLGAEFTSRLPIFFVVNTIIQCYLRSREAQEQGAGI